MINVEELHSIAVLRQFSLSSEQQGKYNKELTTNSGTRIAAAYLNGPELNTGYLLLI